MGRRTEFCNVLGSTGYERVQAVKNRSDDAKVVGSTNATLIHAEWSTESIERRRSIIIIIIIIITTITLICQKDKNIILGSFKNYVTPGGWRGSARALQTVTRGGGGQPLRMSRLAVWIQAVRVGVFCYCRIHCSRTYTVSLSHRMHNHALSQSLSLTGLICISTLVVLQLIESALFSLPLVLVTECLARWNHNHGLLSVSDSRTVEPDCQQADSRWLCIPSGIKLW